MPAYCVRAFAEALEVVPYTLAENAGLSPIAVRSTHQSFNNCKQAHPLPAPHAVLNCSSACMCL
jgi:chaperonin GroEL (HSP60 family)